MIAGILGSRVDRHLTKLPAATLLAVAGAPKQTPCVTGAATFDDTPAIFFQFTRNLFDLFLGGLARGMNLPRKIILSIDNLMQGSKIRKLPPVHKPFSKNHSTEPDTSPNSRVSGARV